MDNSDDFLTYFQSDIPWPSKNVPDLRIQPLSSFYKSNILEIHHKFPQLGFETVSYIVEKAFQTFNSDEAIPKIHAQNISSRLIEIFSQNVHSTPNQFPKPLIKQNTCLYDLHGYEPSLIPSIIDQLLVNISKNPQITNLNFSMGVGSHSDEHISLNMAIALEFVHLRHLQISPQILPNNQGVISFRVNRNNQSSLNHKSHQRKSPAISVHKPTKENKKLIIQIDHNEKILIEKK